MNYYLVKLKNDKEVVVTTCGHELGCCNDEYKLDEVELYIRTDDGFIEI